jgi:hypothetical protein
MTLGDAALYNVVPARGRDTLNRHLIKCACGCGAWIYSHDKDGKPRRWVKGHHARKQVKAPRKIELSLWLTQEQIAQLDAKVEEFGSSRAALTRKALETLYGIH